jgi:hypothetical protein
MVYPVLMLLLAGFLSYGSIAVAIACSVLVISVRSFWKMLVGVIVAIFLTLNVFVNYFLNRDYIRDVVWSSATMEQRIGAVTNVITNADWFDNADPRHLDALNQRLNQNFFVGLAAKRIEEGQVDYLYGRSLWEAGLALIPRALWPDKPVFGGSGDIVARMTGLRLSTTSSWGVGNVMEFEINFGVAGVVLGFLSLGFVLGRLDRKAAEAELKGHLGESILFFLPGMALINPIGSLVELAGRGAAALVAAYGWKWLWNHFGGNSLKVIVRRPNYSGNVRG